MPRWTCESGMIGSPAWAGAANARAPRRIANTAGARFVTRSRIAGLSLSGRSADGYCEDAPYERNRDPVARAPDQRGPEGGRAGHPARALLRPRVRARDHAVHGADGERPDL